MADIEPYKQIQKTNIKEHNDLVAKINEIIDVINNTNIDKVIPKITALETDVSTIKATDSLQWTDIESLKDSQSAQDVTIGILDTQVKGVTESLVSDILIIDGITTGNMKVRVEREKAPSIDSNDYNIQKPVSMELIQGSGPSTFKAQITLSDGTIIRSDDFIFTTEAIGTDVYISSFVFKNGNVAGTISADIGLSNGVTIEANNFVVPMDPSLLNTVQDLSTRLSAVEGGTIDGLDELKAQVQTNTSNIGTLTAEIDDLDIQKADQSNPAQTIKADTTDLRTVKLRDSTDAVGSYLQFNADANKPVRMEYYNGSEVVDSGYVATVDSNGNPKNFTIPENDSNKVIGGIASIDYSITIGSSRETTYGNPIGLSIISNTNVIFESIAAFANNQGSYYYLMMDARNFSNDILMELGRQFNLKLLDNGNYTMWLESCVLSHFVYTSGSACYINFTISDNEITSISVDDNHYSFNLHSDKQIATKLYFGISSLIKNS